VTSDTLRELLIIGVLIGLNAIFVAAEIARVTVRRTRLDQLAGEGSRAGRRVGTILATRNRPASVGGS
jgi:CBS domain containing-hemolysin-like protein